MSDLGNSPVFVVGSGRSGTTIMDRSLGEHSLLASFPFEPQVIADPKMRTGLFRLVSGSICDEEKQQLKRHLFKRYSFRSRVGRELGFCGWLSRNYYYSAIEALLSGGRGEPAIAVKKYLYQIYDPYLEKRGAGNWIDGSPVNGRVIPQIKSFVSGK